MCFEDKLHLSAPPNSGTERSVHMQQTGRTAAIYCRMFLSCQHPIKNIVTESRFCISMLNRVNRRLKRRRRLWWWRHGYLPGGMMCILLHRDLLVVPATRCTALTPVMVTMPLLLLVVVVLLLLLVQCVWQPLLFTRLARVLFCCCKDMRVIKNDVVWIILIYNRNYWCLYIATTIWIFVSDISLQSVVFVLEIKFHIGEVLNWRCSSIMVYSLYLSTSWSYYSIFLFHNQSKMVPDRMATRWCMPDFFFRSVHFFIIKSNPSGNKQLTWEAQFECYVLRRSQIIACTLLHCHATRKITLFIECLYCKYVSVDMNLSALDVVIATVFLSCHTAPYSPSKTSMVHEPTLSPLCWNRIDRPMT